MDEPKVETSRYNQANLILLRLHDCWQRCNRYASKGNLHAWKFELDVIWREISAAIKNRTKKGEDMIEQNRILKEKIAMSKSMSELYNNLDERHNYLKSIEDSAGMGGAYEDSEDSLFD